MVTFKRLCNSVRALVYSLKGKSTVSFRGLSSLTDQKIREARALVKTAKQKRPLESKFSELLAELEKIEMERVSFLEI